MSSLEQHKKTVSVTQDNQLIEASYTLTLNEKRLLLLGISKLDPMQFPNKSEPATFELTVEEWEARFPQDDNPWQSVKRAAKKMLSRYVTFHPKTGVIDDISWFDSVRYVEGESKVIVKFSWSITVRLQGMVEQFTKINLLEISKLKSFHSIRLYELLSQFRTTGYRKISIEDFRIAMNCVELYPRLSNMKARVLNPALKELRNKTDFDIECRNVKRGRRITGFEFIISERT